MAEESLGANPLLDDFDCATARKKVPWASELPLPVPVPILFDDFLFLSPGLVGVVLVLGRSTLVELLLAIRRLYS